MFLFGIFEEVAKTTLSTRHDCLDVDGFIQFISENVKVSRGIGFNYSVILFNTFLLLSDNNLFSNYSPFFLLMVTSNGIFSYVTTQYPHQIISKDFPSNRLTHFFRCEGENSTIYCRLNLSFQHLGGII